MNGTQNETGIIPLAALEIFKKAEELDPASPMDERAVGSIVPPEIIKKSIKVSISYIEIYNETINDLLD